MSIQELIQKSLLKTKISQYKTINIVIMDLERLLSSVLKVNREYLITHSDKKINKEKITKFNKLLKKYLENQPLAYIVSRQEFYGIDFYVDKNVLIPRKETELIIDKILEEEEENKIKNKKTKIIDIGTGSGCIIISLAKLLKNTNRKFIASDISHQAIKIAKKNAKKNKVISKIKFIQGNLLEPFKNKIKNNDKIIIIANLPYLKKTQIENSPSIKKEPLLALDGGKNGLELYKKLLEEIKIIKEKLKKINIKIFLEIDPSQTKKIQKIIKKKLQNIKIEIIKDLSQKDRLIIIKQI